MYLIIFLVTVFFTGTATKHNDNIVLLNSDLMKTGYQWRILNDDVMGGLSSSNVIYDDSIIIFSGDILLKNNGGIASLRSPVKDYNFENFSGIDTRIKGDGKRYSISMQETPYFNGYFYTGSFETKKDEWIIIQIPFHEFKLYYFGNETNLTSEFPYNTTKEISLLIGDKQEGSFKTEIDYIKVIKQ